MKFISAIIFLLVNSALAKECVNRKTTSKLICYYSKLIEIDNNCECTHIILPANSELKQIEQFKQNYDKNVKFLINVNEFNQGLINILDRTKVDGLEINLKKLDSKSDITDFISTIKEKFTKDLLIFVSVPAKNEILAKYYDFKALSKHTDYFLLQTAFLGASKNVTFHPSLLSGLWDAQNTDSVVDLVNGLGAPLQKLIITAPVQAYQFELQSENYTAPGSPALEIKSITRNELCDKMNEAKRNWTLERDQDQAGPYIFSKNEWIAFEDATSIDIKAKYTRVRGLAGIALKDLSQDGGDKCGPTILQSAYTGLSRQARAPRGAVLHSLEREILQPQQRPLDTVQLSPYRISRIIDTEGHVHVIRKDTRTEFECSRQGYFVHPRSCNRFYRCVKFDQLSDEFNVFEFDCPAGLAFDERVEVCVWPGSLPHASACAGSSEIAPVPKERFICPGEPGYYADPENCRWFFACMDHGKSPLTAYEFRCPFGLLFDQARLVCEWPWLVPTCANGAGLGIALETGTVYGGGAYQLDQYDGLGTLGAVTLGGLSGTIEQPVAKTYSNVGQVGFAFTNGLGYKATESLQNAGLLRANYEGSAFDAALSHASQSSEAYQQYNNEAAASGVLLTNSGYNLQGLNQVKSSAGNINIVGGGYSAVGLKSGVEITNNGAHLEAVTPSPIPVTTASSIPLVSSVPVPAIRTAHEFEAYNGGGGVIANVPELQYRYEQPGFVNLTNYASVSTVAPTASVLLNQPVVNVKENVGGYVYEKPSVAFKEGIVVSSTPRPFAVVQPVQSTGTSYSYQQQAVQNNQGYVYEKPGIAFEEGVINGYTVSSTARPAAVVPPVISGYSVSSTAKPLVVQPNGAFQEGSVSYSTVKPLTVVQPVQKQGTGYSYQQQAVQNQGYVYEKPRVAFEEGVVSGYTVSSTVKPVAVVQPVKTSYNYQQQAVQNQGYVYEKPSVAFEEGASLAGNSVSFQQQNTIHTGGYEYEKPRVAFEEVPLKANYAYSTVKPAVAVVQQEIPVQPAVNAYVSSYSDVSTVRPIVSVSPKITPLVQQVNIKTIPDVSAYSYQEEVKSNAYYSPQPAVVYNKQHIEKTIVQQPEYIQTYQQPVSSYSYQSVAQQALSKGYAYPKPQIAFEETPIVSSTPRPAVLVPQTPVVSSYNYVAPPTTVKPAVLVQQQGYVYPKPQVAFEEVPIIASTPKPAVVSSYNYVTPVSTPKPAVVGYSYPKPQVVFEESPKPAVISSYNYLTPSTTAKPTVLVQQPQVVVQQTPVKPAVVSSYNYVAPSTTAKPVLVQPQVVSSYNYVPIVSSTPKPAVVSYNYVSPSTTVKPIVYQQPAISTYTYQNVAQQAIAKQGYVYPKPQIRFEETPAVSSYNYVTPSTTVKPAVVPIVPIQTTLKPQTVQFTGYNYQKPVVAFEERPVPVQEVPFVKKTAYVTGQPAVVEQKTVQFTGYSYAKPAVAFEERPVPVQEVPFFKKTAYVTGQVNQPVVVENYKAPVQTYSQSIDTSKSYYYNYAAPQVNYVQPTTPRPTYTSTVAAVVKPQTENGFYYFDSRYAPTPAPVPVVPSTERAYLVPEVTKPARVYLPSTTPTPTVTYSSTVPIVKTVTTSRPIVRYEFSSLDDKYAYIPPSPKPVVTSTTPAVFVVPEVTKPSREYLPVRNRVRVQTTTIPTSSYLPPINNYDSYEVTTRRPVAKVVKVVRPRPQTIVKVNDYHPLLSMKLGAQCTCTSNSVRLRKKPLQIVVDDEDNDNYAYDDEDDDGYAVRNNDESVIVENYKYEPQRTVEITPAPQVIVKETTGVVPVVPVVRKRVRVRPVSPPTSNINEIFIKQSSSEESVSDHEIVKAVRTGLKLVKQAAKEGAKEGTKEALENRQLDRYGPGGWRGRDETLQGTIDCQRPGLFRHPKQCNKFYACRWDCTKNRYTLHVFNCPVHLTFDNNLGACNWPSQGPACLENTLLPSD